MQLQTCKKVFLGTCALSIIIIVFVYMVIINGYHDNKDVTIRDVSKNRTHFLVDTPMCKIPVMDPFDATIRHLITPPKSLQCSDRDGLTYQSGNMVYVNQAVVKKLYAKRFKHCDSETLIRVNTNDSSYKLIPNTGTFTINYTLSKEFTRITCYDTLKKVIHRNFYLINIPKSDAEKRYKESFNRHVTTNRIKHSYNVVLMGLDGVSRLNFQRHITQTRAYLLNDLKAIEMTGYTRIADNTFPNLTPMFTGKYVHELPYIHSRDKNKSFDRFDMIFKQFAAVGYRTSYAEDAPHMALFNSVKQGFYKQPADDYIRPMTLAIEKEKSLRRGYCVHERTEQDIFTDNVYRFMSANQNAERPYFSFTFLSRITHDDMNMASLVDGPHVRFLRRVHKENLLNNTIMLYMSDHGMRYGEIRDTFIGRIATRLPAMYVYLPPAFKRDNPQLYKNVEVNAHRITTAFDIYETLRDILHFNDSVGRVLNRTARGISLFSKVPVSRTCKDAGILPHWCACASQEPLPLNDTLVVRSTDVLVRHLNKLLQKSPCEILHLDQITRAYKIIPNIKILTYIHKTGTHEKVTNINSFHKNMSVSLHYDIVIVTSPGGGRFDATVKHDTKDDRMAVTGDVSRTNVYGNTSWCVNDTTLKKFCYCKQQL